MLLNSIPYGVYIRSASIEQASSSTIRQILVVQSMHNLLLYFASLETVLSATTWQKMVRVVQYTCYIKNLASMEPVTLSLTWHRMVVQCTQLVLLASVELATSSATQLSKVVAQSAHNVIL